MSDLLRKRFLKIAQSGIVAQYTPKQLSELRLELLAFPTDSLNPVEFFSLLELQFYVSLLTNHDVEAKAALDRIVDQFGADKSQRIKVLQSLYLESIGEDEKATKILTGNPDELELSRRLTTFSRKTGKNNNEDNSDYINTLIFFLDLTPSDIKTWAELANEYSKTGNYERAIFCYKEILLYEPYAYNIFYKVGLQYYYHFLQIESGLRDKKEKLLEAVDILTNSRNNFLRSVELCESFEKGWLGVYTIGELEFNKKLSSKSPSKESRIFLEDGDKLRDLSKKNSGSLISLDKIN
ncbi:ER membrane protein complex subunit 2 [[Candida] anglica]|uniref:ER membrane protein complex subunit 2 n=1 Tax=[Candida] anglica TaxID=148631 RepID=A0ABP0EAZ5_9ASCO